MLKDPFDIRLIEQVVASIFPRSSPIAVERVEEGVSTCVYKIRYAGEIFYLRVLPEKGASFVPEALVHQLLRDRQVKVPEVLYFEHRNEALQRSLMLTTEIKGASLHRHLSAHELRAVLLEAGRDLAIINGIPVEQFGWIKRDKPAVSRLEAELPSYRAFVYDYLESDLAILLQAQALERREIAAIRRMIEDADMEFDSEQAYLAHGDFDVTHIYQKQSRYTGIIDFGEIRGANALYDLGHFRMHDGETLPIPALAYLIEGYKEVADLPADYERKIYLSSLLIAIRALARSVQKGRDIRNHQGMRSIRRDLQAMGTMK